MPSHARLFPSPPKGPPLKRKARKIGGVESVAESLACPCDSLLAKAVKGRHVDALDMIKMCHQVNFASMLNVASAVRPHTGHLTSPGSSSASLWCEG
jgi:hypothetical protein